MFKRCDHVSVAVDNFDEAYKIFIDKLGGRIIRGPFKGYDGAFSWVEFSLGGQKMELIQPEGEDSFVTKFLKNKGSKMHHLAFEVEDLEEAIKTLEGKGFRIMGKTMDDPEWKIAFIHPGDVKGVLIEIFEPKVKP